MHNMRQRESPYRDFIVAASETYGRAIVNSEPQIQQVAGDVERDQVRLIRQTLEALGMEIATPAEARAMLELKGRDKVNL